MGDSGERMSCLFGNDYGWATVVVHALIFVMLGYLLLVRGLSEVVWLIGTAAMRLWRWLAGRIGL